MLNSQSEKLKFSCMTKKKTSLSEAGKVRQAPGKGRWEQRAEQHASGGLLQPTGLHLTDLMMCVQGPA